MKKIFLLLFCLIICRSGLQAQTTKSAAKLALENEISALKKDPTLRNASWGLYVYNITTSQPEAELNSQLSLMPASAIKILTTATALALLGNDFRFETALQTTGIADTVTGILQGNLYLCGGGDPTLGSKRFDASVNADTVFSKFARALLKSGIRRVEGQLIGDESIFDDRIPQSWAYEDIGNYYAPAVCGLSIYENMYRLYFDAGKTIGDSARLTDVEPEMPDMTFVNMVTTGAAGTGDQIYILGNPYTTLRILDGTLPVGKTHFDIDGALPDPAMACMQQFMSVIKRHGIEVTGGTTTLRKERWQGTPDTTSAADRRFIAKHLSPTLSQIIVHTNLKSINMFAEHILKMIGAKKTGTGSTQQGIAMIRQYWTSKGIDLKGFEMFDGSGLSRKNKITPQQLCRILAGFKNETAYKSFKASLPVAGKNGGVGSMLKGTVAENNLCAKTGTMDDVRAYAGYVTNTTGEELAFAIIINNFTGPGVDIRKKCEKLMLLFAQLD